MKLRGHLEDPVQDGRIIWNTDPKGIGCGWGWVHLAQDGNQ